MINDIIKAIILLLTLIALIMMLSKWIIKNILQLIKDLWDITAQKFAEQYQAYNAKYNPENQNSKRKCFIENFKGIPVLGYPSDDEDEILEIPSLNKIMAGSTNKREPPVPSWEAQLKKNLQPYLEQNYRIIEKINSLPQDWQNYSVRKLKKICTEINQIRPKTITGHASKKVNKRLLIIKIQKLAKV